MQGLAEPALSADERRRLHAFAGGDPARAVEAYRLYLYLGAAVFDAPAYAADAILRTVYGPQPAPRFWPPETISGNSGIFYPKHTHGNVP